MSLIGCHTLAGTGIEYPKKKPAWRYIKGDEKDFAGAPDWCKQVIKQNGTCNLGYEENCNGLQIAGDRIWWPDETSLDDCNTLGERDVNGTSNVEVIAQRELVTSVNDDRLARDMVNHPSHYTQGGIECIDAIKAATVGKTGIEAVAVANVIKYLWRYEQKGGIESVKKARWYLERLINELSKGK